MTKADILPNDTRRRLPRLTHTKPVVVPLAGVTVFSALVALAAPASVWKDLAVNLLADAVSLWFGLFVVELALELGREEMRRPARQAMANDLIRLRMPITHILTLLLWDTASANDLPTLRAAAGGEGDVADILARRRLTTSPAPMRQLGWIGQPQATWHQVIWAALSPKSLSIEVLVARYVSVADARMLAALQGLEVSFFMDVLRGRYLFDDNIVLGVFWGSLLQSLAALDAELEYLLGQLGDPSAVLGPGSYINFVIGQIEQGNQLEVT